MIIVDSNPAMMVPVEPIITLARLFLLSFIELKISPTFFSIFSNLFSITSYRCWHNSTCTARFSCSNCDAGRLAIIFSIATCSLVAAFVQSLMTPKYCLEYYLSIYSNRILVGFILVEKYACLNLAVSLHSMLKGTKSISFNIHPTGFSSSRNISSCSV